MFLRWSREMRFSAARGVPSRATGVRVPSSGSEASARAGATASSEIAARIPARPRKLPIPAKIAIRQSNVSSGPPAIIRVMGKVVELDPSGKGKPRAQRQARAKRIRLQDGARPGRRRLHGRRLRDRRAPRARPPGRQPHRQRVRHLRRHQRRVVHRQPHRQRRHARGDDARPQLGPALADPGHRPLDASAPQLRRLHPGLPDAAPQGGGHRQGGLREGVLDRRSRDRPRRALAARLLQGHRHRALRARGPLRPRPHRRLPPPRRGALPHRHRPRHHRARDHGRGRLGGRADLEGRRRLRGAADDLRAGRGQGSRVHRRRHPLDDEHRRRDRARAPSSSS